MVTYSNAKYSDLDQMAEVWFSGFQEFLNRKKWRVSNEEIKDVLELYLSAGHAVVAKDQKKVIGYMIWVNDIQDIKKTIFSNRWALKFFLTSRRRFIRPQARVKGVHAVLEVVHPSFQRHGIGSRLRDIMIDRVECSGAKSMTFVTECSNKTIQDIYTKRGFKKVKKIWQLGYKWVLMKKEFSSPSSNSGSK